MDGVLTCMFHKDYSLEAYEVLQYYECRKCVLRYGTGNAYTSKSRCACGKRESVKPNTQQSGNELHEENTSVDVGLTLLDAIEEAFWDGTKVGASD